jgi:hypothetical protein
MTFISSVLRKATHPINIIPEYYDAFGSKPKAAILSWLDGWKRTSGKEWVWLVLEDLAQELKWCRDTLHRHLKELLNLNVIERKRANRWPTDQAFQYRLNQDELLKHIDFQDDFQTVVLDKSDSGESEDILSTVRNSEIYLNQLLNPEPNQTQNITNNAEEDVACNVGDFSEEFQEEEVPASEPVLEEDMNFIGIEVPYRTTWDGVKEECFELQIQFSAVRQAIKKYSPFVVDALVDVWVASQQGWMKNPTGKFLASIKRRAQIAKCEAKKAAYYEAQQRKLGNVEGKYE